MPKREPDNIFSYLHNQVHVLNNSKIFAGLMIIILNISSRFVNIKLSKSMESYLKHTFSKQILVFAIAWMGTREIYVALFITLLFTLCVEYLFNEDSAFCCLPNSFKEYHIELMENADVTDEEIVKAKEVLEKAKKKNKDSELKEYTITNVENYKNYLS
jgi:hypothetical protein